MKIAYFDCYSGISGDMTVGAFLDAGLKFALLKKRLRLLNISGYKIDAFREARNGVYGTKFDVKLDKKRHFKSTSYSVIKGLIRKSGLDADTKSISLLIFEKLASAEARIHNRPKEAVHFHEVGALDSIIDIVSTAIAVTELDIKEFYCLSLNLAMPAPAALELLKNKSVSFLDVDNELVTPTGAAILTALVNDFTKRPEIDIEAVGYGAGTFKIKEIPNLLRVILGNSKEASLGQDARLRVSGYTEQIAFGGHPPKSISPVLPDNMKADEVVVIETNIDDMNPVSYEYLIETLFKKGALDVFLTPVYMKKTRPAVLLTVLCKDHLLDTLARTIMRETTSSGVRYCKAGRKILERVIRKVKTKYGVIRVKQNTGPDGIITQSPEYEDCRRIAIKTGVPFKVIFNEAASKKNILK